MKHKFKKGDYFTGTAKEKIEIQELLHQHDFAFYQNCFDFDTRAKGYNYIRFDGECWYGTNVASLCKKLISIQEMRDLLTEFKLPEKWKIYRTPDNYQVINQYFNDFKAPKFQYDSDAGYLYSHPINNVNAHVYSEVDGFTIGKPSDFTEITIEQFNKYVLNQEMKELPKYFVIKSDLNNPLWSKYIEWLNNTYNNAWFGETFEYYGCDGNIKYNGVNGFDKLAYFENNPTLITLEQWDSIINKTNNMNKEIIGYKLLKDLPDVAKGTIGSISIDNCIDFKSIDILPDGSDCCIYTIDFVKTKPDWFEPVYKAKYELPKIAGYDGKYDGSIITYGCQSFTKEWFLKLYSLFKESSSINTIEIVNTKINIEELQQIKNYIDNYKK